ncbi:MAG: hypothetical protein HY841_03150 [Bacteroidetes bacterium]|nr:hypothetical protein [Bacteroidota bacterium]
MKRKLFLCVSMLCIAVCLCAQTFNYSFTQSAGSYQSLTGATTAANSNTWSGSGYKIPIGFAFNFAGKSFDTLTLTSNGLLLFGNDNKRAIATFKGIMPVKDSTGAWSSLLYKTESGILKIEYKNCGFGMNSPDLFNFQVWLSQSGNKVEFHTGSTTLSTLQDSLIMPIVGLINPSMDKTNNGYLLTGNPSQANAETAGAGDLKYIIRVPDANTVYTLTPQ